MMLSYRVRTASGCYQSFVIHCPLHLLGHHLSQLHHESQGTGWRQKSVYEPLVYPVRRVSDLLSDVDIGNGLEYR